MIREDTDLLVYSVRVRLDGGRVMKCFNVCFKFGPVDDGVGLRWAQLGCASEEINNDRGVIRR